MRPKPGDRAMGVDLGCCPDCGEPIGIAFALSGEPQGMVHALPMCATFEALSPPDYLKWVGDVRDAAARPVGEA